MLVLLSNPAMDCRVDCELKVGVDGSHCLHQPLGLHGSISLSRAKGEEAGLGSDGGVGSQQLGNLLGAEGKDSSPGRAWPG